MRWDRSGRWVPHSTSSGQAPSAGSGRVLRGRRDVVRLGPPKTAGRLTMNGRGWGTEVGRRGLGAAWDVFSRSGECVQFWGQCVQFSGGCVQFLAECVHFRGECVHFGGRCVQFWRCALVGDGRGRKARFAPSASSGQAASAGSGQASAGSGQGRSAGLPRTPGALGAKGAARGLT